MKDDLQAVVKRFVNSQANCFFERKQNASKLFTDKVERREDFRQKYSPLYFAPQSSSESTYYLFRYQVSDYESSEVKEGEWEYRYNALNPTASGWTFKNADTNAYFFKETVNLDFDIIDVTFNKNGTLAVIPVVMNPIDVIPSATPPVYTETDTDKMLWWKLLLGLAGLILLVIILAPVLPYIIQGVWFVITLPVKAVAILVKSFRKEKPK